MKNHFLFITVLIAITTVTACSDEEPAKPQIGGCYTKISSVVNNLETIYGCKNTNNSLKYNSSDEYKIIRTQQEFIDLTEGDCQPQIDFQKYDLLIGKKKLTSGTHSIQYNMYYSCDRETPVLNITFIQNVLTVISEPTYNALIPKMDNPTNLKVNLKVE
jgi:hypothetical protein